MLKIPNDKLGEFKSRFQTHKVNIAACNIFFQTIRMLNGRHKILDRNTYQDTFLNTLSDIELVTPPTDSFVPCDKGDDLFDVNQLTPEYVEISKRVPLTLIETTFDPTNEIAMLLKEKPEKLTIIHDDLYLYWCLYKYLDHIDMIRLNTYSNYTPIIEYIVENISLNDWKQYMSSRRINEEKYAKQWEDLIFNPDIAATEKFYMNKDGYENIPTFDVVNLLMRLTSNTVLKTDIILLLGVYLTISFAMQDLGNKKIDDSPCIKYVREVLSVL